MVNIYDKGIWKSIKRIWWVKHGSAASEELYADEEA